MPFDENRVIVRRFIEEMMSGQHVERIDEFVAPDAVHHEGFREVNYRDALHSVFDDPKRGWEFEIEDIVAEGDRVVARCIASYSTRSNNGPFGIPYKAGTRASVRHAHFFRLEEGKIVEHWPAREIWEAVKQFNAPTKEEASVSLVG